MLHNFRGILNMTEADFIVFVLIINQVLEMKKQMIE